MKGNKNILLTALLCLSVLQGCIRHSESGVDCDRTRVMFRYYGDVPGTDRFLDKMDMVTLFIYDSEGRLVAQHSRLNGELGSQVGINLNLPDGNYELVGWTNLSENTLVLNPESLDDAIVCCSGYQSSSDGTVRDRENDRVYFSRKSITVVQSEFRDEVMEFSQSHVPLSIYIANAGAPTRASAPVELAVRNINPQISFDGSCLSSVKGTYYPPLVYNEETREYKCCLNAYRFDDDNDIQLQLLDKASGEAHKTLELTDFMSEYSISVDNKDEAGISIRFRFATTGVEFKPWNEEDVDPELN